MATNHGGDPVGSILGSMGSHWVQKMGQNRKKLPCPKIEYSTTPRSSIFCKKWKLLFWRQITVGIPWGLSRGQWGPIGSKKWVKTVQNYHARLPRDHRFFPKNGSYGYGTKSRWGLPRVHHGANGYHRVQKIGQKRRKLPCPKIRIFHYPAVIDFLQKIEVTVIVPNHGGDPVGSI